MFAMHLKPIQPSDVLELLGEEVEFSSAPNAYESKTSKFIGQMNRVYRNASDYRSDVDSDVFNNSLRLDSRCWRPSASNIRRSIKSSRKIWLLALVLALIVNGLVNYLQIRDKCQRVLDILQEASDFADLFGDVNYFSMQFAKLYAVQLSSPKTAFDQVVSMPLFKFKLQAFLAKRSRIVKFDSSFDIDTEIEPYTQVLAQQKNDTQRRIGNFIDTALEIVYRVSLVGGSLAKADFTAGDVDWSNVMYLANFAYLQQAQRKKLELFYFEVSTSLFGAKVGSYVFSGIHATAVVLFALAACSLILTGEKMTDDTLEVFSKFRVNLLKSKTFLMHRIQGVSREAQFFTQESPESRF